MAGIIAQADIGVRMEEPATTAEAVAEISSFEGGPDASD
jgi:hypothetical protein